MTKWTFEHRDVTFEAELHHDDHMAEPWRECDGHGPVSEWTTRDKNPGELVLASDKGFHRYYDFAEAVRIAKRDGWALRDFKGTRGQMAEAAARADYERLRAWCNDEWHWCFMLVRHMGACANCSGYESVGGLESDASDYHKEVALELADNMLAMEAS